MNAEARRLVSEFYHVLDKVGLSWNQLAAATEIAKDTPRMWRVRGQNPHLSHFLACLNACGYTLEIVENDDEITRLVNKSPRDYNRNRLKKRSFDGSIPSGSVAASQTAVPGTLRAQEMQETARGPAEGLHEEQLVLL